MDICHLKSAELETQHQKYKGRVVLRGDIVKDNSGSYAVFAEQGSSASQMTAAKVMDTSSNSADQLRSLGPKSDYDKDQKTEVSMFSFYVDSWYAALNRGVRTNLAKSQSLECADNPWTPQHLVSICN